MGGGAGWQPGNDAGKKLCLKNLQLSNIAVTEEGTICFMDLIHQDCGLVRTAVDNHAYYIARELEAYGEFCGICVQENLHYFLCL